MPELLWLILSHLTTTLIIVALLGCIAWAYFTRQYNKHSK